MNRSDQLTIVITKCWIHYITYLSCAVLMATAETAGTLHLVAILVCLLLHTLGQTLFRYCCISSIIGFPGITARTFLKNDKGQNKQTKKTNIKNSISRCRQEKKLRNEVKDGQTCLIICQQQHIRQPSLVIDFIGHVHVLLTYSTNF